MYSGSSAIAAAESAAVTGMHQIEQMSDADISEVQESASLFPRNRECDHVGTPGRA